jgi:Sulfotransferase family
MTDSTEKSGASIATSLGCEPMSQAGDAQTEDSTTVEDAWSSARAPDFFIVGHHKSGTTALYEILRRRPDIYMPDRKEPWFFAKDLRVRFAPETPLPQTLEEYLSLFSEATPEQVIGEATPSYLMSRTAASDIADVQPSARIIAILREPANYLRSFHLQSVRNHAETETNFRRALALEDSRRRGQNIPREAIRPQELLYSEHVRYVEQLRRYYDVFPKEQVLVLIYEDFRRDNEATARQVLRFLGVNDAGPIEQVEPNATVRVRSKRLYNLLRAVYLGQGPIAKVAKSAIKSVTPRQLRRDAHVTVRRRLIFGSPQPPDEELMRELRRRFKGEVVALSEYLDRDLVTLWGYDRLD